MQTDASHTSLTSLTFDVLPASTVAVIAARYGFDPAERVVTENAEQARQYHGKPCGRSENGRDGAYDAVELLDSYLAQESYTGRCDAAAAADFEDAAYGSDWND
jgi:hypothetical protein